MLSIRKSERKIQSSTFKYISEQKQFQIGSESPISNKSKASNAKWDRFNER